MKTDQVVKQLNALRSRYRKAKDSSSSDDKMPRLKVKELLASARAAIHRFAPPDSAYLLQLSQAFHESPIDDYRLEALMGIVEALRHDYAAGGLAPIQELIRAEVFDDFLEMSEHLLDQGYKDPAAVVAGSVLEQHLRKLCHRAGIPTVLSGGVPKKADALNSELAANSVYGKIRPKERYLLAWST